MTGNYLYNPKGTSKNTHAFSLTEVMIASSISACLITGVALIMSSIGSSLQKQKSNFIKVNIGHKAAKAYYNINSESVNSYNAPNYGRAASADRLKSKFNDDITDCSAVFCLARDGVNTIRPVYIPLDNDIDARTLDSPEAFRNHLGRVMTQSQSVFKSWRGVSQFKNGSIFILSSSGFDEFIAVRAVYDIDFLRTTSPEGTYASVKRYSWNQLTDYYDVFYPEVILNESFASIFSFYEKRTRRILKEQEFEKFKMAREMPFYFIWWPDPTFGFGNRSLFPPSGEMSSGTSNPNDGFHHGKLAYSSNYFFTVPLSPSL